MKKIVAAIAGLLLSASIANAACWQWSQTAASNGTADPSINWAEGMAPSAVNDSARAMMARLAECRDDLSGKLVSAGTSTAYTVATNQVLASVPNDGQSITLKFHVTNGVAPTLTADGGTTYPIQSAAGVAVGTGVLLANAPYSVTFRTASSAWILQSFFNTTAAANSIATAMLQDNAVTYPKIQKPTTTSRVLGTPSVAAKTITGAADNGSGLIRLTMASTSDLTTGQIKVVSGVVGTTEANASWTITVVDGTHVDLQGSTFANVYVSGGTFGGSVEELTVGAGLQISTNVLSSTTAASFPPPSAFKNLVIKVTGNTGLTVTADFVTTTNGTIYQTTPVSCTINMGTTGINALDTGSIATSTWYAVWVVAKSDLTTGCTASLQGTANGTFTGNLPSGYTYYARVGWVRTASGVAQLMGTWQFGRIASYKLGLANTTVVPLISAGTTGSATVPTWTGLSVANFVPTTASRIEVSVVNQTGTYAAVAPNNSYGAITSRTIAPPIISNGTTALLSISKFLTMESGSIFYGAAAASDLYCLGWDDNI